MAKLEELVTKYKERIKFGKKSTNCLIEWMSENLDVNEITLSKFTDAFIKILKYNAVNAITNMYFNKSESNMHFIIFEVLDTQRNRDYFNKPFIDSDGDIVYVIFEKNTDFISSNNSKLLLDLSIRRGINKVDYDHKTVFFKEYISCIDLMEKKEY